MVSVMRVSGQESFTRFMSLRRINSRKLEIDEKGDFLHDEIKIIKYHQNTNIVKNI